MTVFGAMVPPEIVEPTTELPPGPQVAQGATKGPPESAVSVSVDPEMEPVAVTYVESE
jgi:hypothetical protein